MSAQASGRELGRLIAAAQAGDELAFQRLLRGHQRLLEQAPASTSRAADADDALQDARIGFAKAVRAYWRERGATSWVASRCVGRQLATVRSNR
jgi:DNA-directed RNA polymerase specialized sigma24 family protein